MKTRIDRLWLAWALLVVSFFIGCSTTWGGAFVDEADNLVVGLLLTRGYLLYRDIFSHHFPFPYYWVAAVVSLFGKSIFAVRLSVWLFQIVSFGIAMKLSGYRLSLGLAALIWSILRHLYFGNMVLYYSFSGASLVVVFTIALATTEHKSNAIWKHSLAMAFFSTISILSHPLSVYAVVVALVCLLAKNLRQGAIASILTLGGLSCYAGYLLASGTFPDFLRDAIFFNSQIYAKYTYTNPLRAKELWHMVTKGLEIVDKTWLDFDPFKPISSEYSQFDRWAFTGFVYRLSLVGSAIYLALRRQFLAALFMYVFASAILIIGKWGFHSQPFVMVSLVAVAAVTTREWWHGEKSKIIEMSEIVVSFLFGLLVMWLGFRLIIYTSQNRNTLLYETSFRIFEIETARIRESTCNQSDVLLAHYPGGTYSYWFADMEPVSKYVFMWPWVAEVGMSDVLGSLGQEGVLAVVVLDDDLIGGRYDTREYLHSLHEYLSNNYVKIEDGLYISPELAVLCPRAETETRGSVKANED